MELGCIYVKSQPTATNLTRIFTITAQGLEKAKNIINIMSTDYIDKIKSNIFVKLHS